MKRSMKKFMVTCAAVSAIAAVTSASAMAANYDAATNTATYEVPTAAADTQMTVLVIPEAAEAAVTDDAILWIDQAAPVDGTAKLKGESLEDGTYLVKVGYYKEDGSFAIAEETFKLGEDDEKTTVKVGDVDQNTRISTADATAVLKHTAGTATLEGLAFEAAKLCDGNTRVTTADATAILKYTSGDTSTDVGTEKEVE